MKIALICPNYPPSSNEGGVSHYTQRLGQSLSSKGNDVFVITNGEYHGSGTDGNVQILKFSEKWNGHTAKEIAKILRSLSIDIVNLQYTPSMYSINFKFNWRNYIDKCVSTVSLHTLWGGSKLNYIIALKLLKSVYGIIATNSEIVYLLKKYLPFYLKKTEFIPIGPNIEPEAISFEYTKILKKYSIKQTEIIITFFGMIYPGKGLSLLFNTLNILKRKYKLDVQLLIVGGGESDYNKYIQKMRQMAQELRISRNIIWTGQIAPKEVSQLLLLSNLIVLPFTSGVSDRRGSLLSAVAHRKAVITTKPQIPIEFFKNGNNMLWPDTNEPEALAKEIYRVISNEDFKQRLENGAGLLSQKFKWSEIGQKTHSFFTAAKANNI